MWCTTIAVEILGHVHHNDYWIFVAIFSGIGGGMFEESCAPWSNLPSIRDAVSILDSS